MKKTLLNLALVATLASVSAQGISTVAAFDDFMDGNSANAGIDPYAVEDKDHFAWDTTAKAPSTTKKAYKGIYWWTDGATGGLDYTSTRGGDGKLVYTLTQPKRSYEPIGVGFGEYAASSAATKSSKYFLDLSNNAEMSITIKKTSTAPFRVEFQMEDAKGKRLTANKAVLPAADGGTDANLYDDAGRIQLMFDAEGVSEKTLNFNWKDAVYGYYTAGSATSEDEPTFTCTNVQNKEKPSVTDFAYDSVVAVTITFTSTVEASTDCYRQQGLTGATFEISNFKLGDQTTVVGVSDEIIANFKNEVVTVYNFSGAYVAQGNVEDLNLSSGLYIFKSASKAKKVYVK